MRLLRPQQIAQKGNSPSALVVCKCIHCGQRLSVDAAYCDLDGVAYRDYYCGDCARDFISNGLATEIDRSAL